MCAGPQLTLPHPFRRGRLRHGCGAGQQQQANGRPGAVEAAFPPLRPRLENARTCAVGWAWECGPAGSRSSRAATVSHHCTQRPSRAQLTIYSTTIRAFAVARSRAHTRRPSLQR
ncbi:hypothetical protein CERSUDRAFT_112691 [Gelatoporia subvermispora B]|uniref:Uncharacterized protein n=1 Tax=Ceriporiopsis subvermispora (strain B) TaxID=914234 RepID=M2R382_CERS8|nr:hypothetical protein CERSUDRAFT_112691 [Gelatoporia subvermispora B]